MTLIYTLPSDGSFLCGDTATNLTAYAYPTSPAATEARRDPLAVATRMLAFERPREELAKIAAGAATHRYHSILANFLEQDSRHWRALGDAWAMVES